ncbi:MAG: class I SAM-dependent methyltransferase [Microbacterium enclense]
MNPLELIRMSEPASGTLTIEVPDDPLARALRAWPDRPALALLRAIEAALYDAPPEGVLDIGCGNGKFAAVINLSKAVGVDLLARDIALARDTGLYRDLLHTDARRMPFADNSIQYAICNSTLEHIACDGDVVKEVSRVLRPGGTFAFTVPSENKEKTLLYGRESVSVTADEARRYREWFTDRWHHCHYRAQSEWKNLLRDNRLEVVELRRYETLRSGFIGDALGYTRIVREPIPELRKEQSTADEVRLAILYQALVDYWRDDVASPDDGVGGYYVRARRM